MNPVDPAHDASEPMLWTRRGDEDRAHGDVADEVIDAQYGQPAANQSDSQSLPADDETVLWEPPLQKFIDNEGN